MASNPQAAEITASHQQRQTAIKAQAQLAALELWPLFDPDNPQPWVRANAAVIQEFGRDSVAAGADYFVAYSAAETGLRYQPPPDPPPIDTSRIASTLFGSGPEEVSNLLRSGKPLDAAMRTARVKTSGAVGYLTLEPHREMLVEAPTQDYGGNPAPRGWARVTTSAKPCAFCAMLASRGPAYRSEGSASFDAHFHCACTVEPVYSRTAEWPGRAREYKQTYDDAIARAREAGELNRGTNNDLLNAFRRAFET